jgi:hypothetical protein
MRELVYDGEGVMVFKEGPRYFVRYDAGAHQVVLREDEISEDEARQVMDGMTQAARVLSALQKRLTLAGIDPCVSNLK